MEEITGRRFFHEAFPPNCQAQVRRSTSVGENRVPVFLGAYELGQRCGSFTWERKYDTLPGALSLKISYIQRFTDCFLQQRSKLNIVGKRI